MSYEERALHHLYKSVEINLSLEKHRLLSQNTTIIKTISENLRNISTLVLPTDLTYRDFGT